MMMLSGLGAEKPLSASTVTLLDQLKTKANHKFRWDLHCWATYMGVKNGVLATKIQTLLESGLAPSERRVWEDRLAGARNNKDAFRAINDIAVQAQQDIDKLKTWDEVFTTCPIKTPRAPSLAGLGIDPLSLSIYVALYVGAALVTKYVLIDGLAALIKNMQGMEAVGEVEDRVDALNECMEQQKASGVTSEQASKLCVALVKPRYVFFSPFNILLVLGGVYLYTQWRKDKT